MLHTQLMAPGRPLLRYMPMHMAIVCPAYHISNVSTGTGLEHGLTRQTNTGKTRFSDLICQRQRANNARQMSNLDDSDNT